jgi:hypothetical protein
MSAQDGLYSGSCHCGAIGFSYRASQSPPAWRLRACQCAFCRAHAALTTSDPAGAITFHEHRSGMLQRYRFGLRTADFLLCRSCGVYIGAEIAGEAGRFGIINVNALRPLPPGLSAPVSMDYDAESIEQRVARRETRWSHVVDARG